MLGYHQKVMSMSSAYSALKAKHKDVLSKKKETEDELAASRLQLSELEDLKRQMGELKLQLSEKDEAHKKALITAHSAGFEEAKVKVVEYYRGQVQEIKIMGFGRGARIFYFWGIAKGYGLGLDAASVHTESDLRAVPEVALPEIDIPPEEEEEEEEEATGEEEVEETAGGGAKDGDDAPKDT